MKRLLLILITAVLLFSLCACRSQRADLKFYVLSAEDVTENMSDSALLSLAKKKGRLAFTGEQVQGYLWAEHQVRLKDVDVRGGAQDGGSRLFQTNAGDLFVLALGGRVIYTGGFEAGAGTVTPPRSPYITDIDETTFAICYDAKYTDCADPRGNERLYNFLTDRQLLVSRFE